MRSLIPWSLSVAMVAGALGPIAVQASGTNVAYESVTRFGVGGDPPQPGTFGADWAAASSVKPVSSPHMPFGLGKMMGGLQSMAAMMQSGTAEKHAIGTTKERTDNVALQTADITDCTARTISHLDLAKKTYTVVSMDQPETGGGSSGPSRPGKPAPDSDDGTRYKIDMSTKALGALTLDSTPTNGYATTITMTAIKPSGETHATSFYMTSYYANFAEPSFVCSRHPMTMPIAGGTGGPGTGASMAQLGLLMKALHTPSGDPRFTVTNSGPSLPSGKMALWTLTTFNGGDRSGGDRGAGGGGFFTLTERGAVRSTTDADPIFSIPADFTKVS